MTRDEANGMRGEHPGGPDHGGRADDSTPSYQGDHGQAAQGGQRPPAKLKTALKSDTPDWKDVQDLSKDFVSLGAGLAKNEPPRGDKSAFEKRADAYYQYAKALDDAAKAEDKAKAQVGAEQDRGLVQGLPRGP